LLLFLLLPLPGDVRVCYKPNMRKWMRDRLKRRKKAPVAGAGEPAPAPLQPAYFDVEVPKSAPAAEVNEPEIEVSPESASSAGPAEVRQAVAAPPSRPQREDGGGDPGRRRRRRGRGGRGRGEGRSSGTAPSTEALRESATGGDVPVASTLERPPGAKAPPSGATGVPKGSVILAIGLPGSGKSSWFKRHNITPLSSDLLRALLFDDPMEQRFQDLVFSNLRSMLKARLIARRPLNYVDATNLTPHERQNWIKLAKDYGYEVQAVFFDVPLEVCLERNQRRQRMVAEDVVRRLSAKLRPPTFEEGFAKITVVRVKQKE
jgi:predicted kinase